MDQGVAHSDLLAFCSRPVKMEKTDCEFRSMGLLNLNSCSRADVKSYFENSYDLYEGAFSAIKEEKYFYMTPERLRLPLIFYLGHSATLYINKMMLAGLIKERVNRDFEILMETGVDEMSWDDTENFRMGGAFEWPTVQQVMEYRAMVKRVVITVIETSPLTLPIHQDHPWWSLIMAIEHERIHLETSSVLLRQLPREFLERPSNWKYAPLSASSSAGRNEFIEVAEGEAILGKPQDFPTFGWDNEYGEATIHVPKFEASKYLVTNKEFHEFVQAGGYNKKEFWSEEGWEWAQFRQAKHPTFWICHRNCKSGCGSTLSGYSHCSLPQPSTGSDENDCVYKYRAIFDMIDMPWDWPVDVNYHEAKAFCNWKGADYRLLTEAEHNRIRGEEEATCDFSCDEVCELANVKYNLNLAFGSSSPVNYFPPNKLGFHDVYGNVYEWIEDHFNGLPEFKTNYLYEDFSSPFFDDRHTMMLGGSWVSNGDQTSRFARLYFRRHFFQHVGFRLARSLTNKPTPVRLCKADHIYTNRFYKDPSVGLIPGADPNHCYILPTNPQFEYDRASICDEIVTKEMGENANYGQPLVTYCEGVLSHENTPTCRALVLGCGPGYSTLLLTKTFQEVVGVDFGGRLVALAEDFKESGHVTLSNGEDFDLPLRHVNSSRATFKQFTWIPNELENFNFVLFESLDRFNNPKGWLLKLHECLLPGGVAIVSSSDSWNAQILQDYFFEWFELIEEKSISGKAVTMWKLVN